MNPPKTFCAVVVCSLFLISSIFGSPHVISNYVRGGTDPVAILTPSELELFSEINLARTNPAQYATLLEQSKKYYVGNEYRVPGRRGIITSEGISAVNEAIAYLRAAKPLPAFVISRGLSLAAKDHVLDLGKTGNTGHKGTDGSTTEIRCARYGTVSNGIGENIVYQEDTAREVVMGWLIDDGVASRGHRRNLMSTGFRSVGLAVGEKTNFGSMCVMTFAGEYAERMKNEK